MSPTHKIKAVFYDLDGTLHTDTPLQLEVFIKGAIEHGLKISDEAHLETAKWVYYYFSQSEELLSDHANYPDEKSFWDNYIRRQLIKVGASSQQAEELFPKLYQYMYDNYRPNDVLLEGVHETLQTLKEMGHILGLVTNRNQLKNKHHEEFGLRTYFDFWLSADQVNSWKPDQKIFKHALQLAGVNANEVVFVGDNYYTDVVGSRNIGMTPVLLDTQNIFEQPDCSVIKAHHQILDILEKGLL